MTDTDGGVVLSRQAALEVLAFLIASARTQCEEAAEYGPMRLLMGAKLFAERLPAGVCDDAMDALVREVASLEPVRTPTRDRERYLGGLDALCTRVADALVAQAGRS